jgi:hypothetical protein
VILQLSLVNVRGNKGEMVEVDVDALLMRFETMEGRFDFTENKPRRETRCVFGKKGETIRVKREQFLT